MSSLSGDAETFVERMKKKYKLTRKQTDYLHQEVMHAVDHLYDK